MNAFSAGARQRPLGDAPLGAAIDQAEAPGRVADHDVVRDRQVRNQGQFLEDAGYAGGDRSGGVGKLDLVPLEQHPALVGRDDAGDDLNECRFSCTVLAEDGMDSAALHIEVGVIKRPYTAVALGDAFHAQERKRGVHRS